MRGAPRTERRARAPRNHPSVATLLAALLSAISVAAPALADPAKPAPAAAPAGKALSKPLSQTLTGQAKADFEAAKLLANDGDFAGALIKFQTAYDAAHDVRLLWNVAFCQKNLRHYAKVVATLKRYVDEGAATLSAADKKDAQDLIATIEPFTTRATITVNESGAQISVDDVTVGTSPLPAPVVLDLGERHLKVTKDGFKPYEKTVPVGAPPTWLAVALGREVHEGRVTIDAPPGAAIFIDGAQVGVGKVDVTLPAGGHQLRVTLPGMRTYQTDVTLADKETRSMSVVLEAEAIAVKPTLRVAVGCGDVAPRGPDDGLVVYLDGPDVLPPTIVKQTWNPDKSQNVIDHVEYALNPGRHTVRVALTGCYAYDVQVDVDPVKGADVSGALETDRGTLVARSAGHARMVRGGRGLLARGRQREVEHARQICVAGHLGSGRDPRAGRDRPVVRLLHRRLERHRVVQPDHVRLGPNPPGPGRREVAAARHPLRAALSVQRLLPRPRPEDGVGEGRRRPGPHGDVAGLRRGLRRGGVRADLRLRRVPEPEPRQALQRRRRFGKRAVRARLGSEPVVPQGSATRRSASSRSRGRPAAATAARTSP